MNTAKKAGFTLVELLVVISIIAVLMAILLPALSTARQMAKGISCMSNLQQLSLAVQMYTDEHNDYYPAAWVIRDTYSLAWCGKYYKENGVNCMDVTAGPLWSYLKEKNILRCRTFSLSHPQVKYTGFGEISGYGINCQYVAGDPIVDLADGYFGMTSYARPACVSQIRKPGETILFADCSRVKNGVHMEEIFIYPLYKHNSTKRNYATFHFRHRGKTNAAFCDGHAEAVKPLELDPEGGGKCGWIANEIMDRD